MIGLTNDLMCCCVNDSVAMNNSSHPACSDVNPATVSLVSVINSLSSCSSSSTSRSAANNHVPIRRYAGRYQATPVVACRDLLPVSHESIFVRPVAAGANQQLTCPVWSQSTPASPADMYRRDLSLRHVDPAVRGACLACDYIRLNTQPTCHTARHYSKPLSSTKSQRFCYY